MRARELEAAINLYRDCGVEIERFSIMELENGITHLCIDGVPRFSWRMICNLPGGNKKGRHTQKDATA